MYSVARNCVARNMMRGLAATLLTGATLAQAQTDTRPAVLKALDGNWQMRGDVRGKPVTYTLTAHPTLQASFTELHMKDVHTPPEYEARVLIGVDAGSGGLIVHWLDSFGAQYSVPHATGTIKGNTLEFTFPYARAPFRDTFTYHPESRSWQFTLEAQQADGSWGHFAGYQVVKAAP